MKASVYWYLTFYGPLGGTFNEERHEKCHEDAGPNRESYCNSLEVKKTKTSDSKSEDLFELVAEAANI